MSTRRLWIAALPLAVVPLVAVGLAVLQSPADAALAKASTFSLTVKGLDTATSPPAMTYGTPVRLLFTATNTSTFQSPFGGLKVTAPAGYALAPGSATISRPEWSVSISGSTVSAVVSRPQFNSGIRPGESVAVGVTATSTVDLRDVAEVAWASSGSGPKGLGAFALSGAAPKTATVPRGQAAFGGVPGTGLNGINAPASQGSVCALDPSNPICSTANLPQGAIGNVYFGQATCSTSEPTCRLGTEVNLNGNFGTLYSPTAPGSVTLTCLASACPHRSDSGAVENEPSTSYDYNYLCNSGCAEGGDPYAEREVNEDFRNYPVYVQPKGATSFGLAPRCVPASELTITGQITDPTALAVGYCVDVNAITRAGNTFSGNLIRPVLFVEDPKMR